MLKKVIKVLLLNLLLVIFPMMVLADTNPLSEAGIKKILQERVDTHKQSVGIVVGIISAKESKIISYGKMATNSKTDVNEQTLFEIGSVSKVFTTLLLAEMVEKGEVKLDEPISKYLPKSVKAPTKNGKEITLLDLATQTSGLPRLPTDFFGVVKDVNNPYKDYTEEHLYQFLSNYTLTREIGAEYEYSNLGMGLLGHILSLRAGVGYEALIINRICKPLGMNDTKITLSLEDKVRLASGYNEAIVGVKNWDWGVLAGAGAIHSTMQDMLKFTNAYMGLTKTDLSAAMEKTLIIYRKTSIPNVEIGLGWHLTKEYNREFFWHNGITAGYHSYLSFDKKTQTGVVVLANCGNDIEDIGRYLMDSNYNLSNFGIKIDPKIFDTYIGEYELAPSFTLTVTREGEHFFVQATNQAKLELLAETTEKFFINQPQVQIEFVKNDQGNVVEVILYQNGHSLHGKKIK